MLDEKNLLQLMKNVLNAYNVTRTYSFCGQELSYQAMEATLRKELNELVGTEDLWEQNKRKLFRLIEQSIDEIVPQRLNEAYGRFAEIKQFAQGERPVYYRTGLGKTRAKQFITHVGLAGKYEIFKLGSESFEVKTNAMGGAAGIGFEEYLDGRVNFAELTQVITEGMDQLLYKEVAVALMSSLNQLPQANRCTVAGYDEATLDYLVNTARAYGTPTIYCSYEFATKIVPAEGWISDEMRNEKWRTGHLANYKGVQVVILQNALEDESNTNWILDPGYVWVIPSGAGEKPVKVAFEGTTHAREVDHMDNADWSREIHVYRKVGVGVMMTNNIFSYVDTTLLGKTSNTNPNPGT